MIDTITEFAKDISVVWWIAIGLAYVSVGIFNLYILVVTSPSTYFCSNKDSWELAGDGFMGLLTIVLWPAVSPLLICQGIGRWMVSCSDLRRNRKN